MTNIYSILIVLCGVVLIFSVPITVVKFFNTYEYFFYEHSGKISIILLIIILILARLI